MLRGFCAKTFILSLLLVLSGSRSSAPSPGAPTAVHEHAGYVGSQACEGCHTSIYQTWRSTRHSYSIRTAADAQRAGYPLPSPRRGGQKLEVQSWDSLSYVVGGRQRISYIDRAGRVLDTGYHQRVGQWDAFPPKRMVDCGPCHFTAFGAGERHPRDPINPGRWAELNIGCEACHGPGKRHAETYEKGDIVVDASSRLCGTCHTAAGRVLPLDDSHATHDLVQTWNRDRHVTGVRSNSHNAFCSRCHSPYQGFFVDPAEGVARRVFAEAKRNITCIACHNPHDLTNAHYVRKHVSLGAPLPPKLHTYQGNDADFLTTDFKEFKSAGETCVQCHRGADRIDLDHANATCNDCHNTFQRNRSRESKVFHDANHPRLSCRQCHRDADDLMAILYLDPDFLQPKNIHNLRRLPPAVISKYKFKYPGLGPRAVVAAAGNLGAVTTPVTRDTQLASYAVASPAQRGTAVVGNAVVSRQPPTGAPERLRELLAREPHKDLTDDDGIQAARAALEDQPHSIARALDLALAYVERGAHGAAREVLERAAATAPTRVLLELPLDAMPRPDTGGNTGDQRARIRALVEKFLPPAHSPDAEATRRWLQSYLEMAEGRFADAAQTLTAAQQLDLTSPHLRFYLGLAQLGEQRYAAAIETLKLAVADDPSGAAPRVALAVGYLKRGRVPQAHKALRQAVSMDPGDPIAHYFLGRGYLRQRNAAKAIDALRAAVVADPAFLDAWIVLARAYRLSGLPGQAADAYREIIHRRPGAFVPRYELASLLKMQSDNVAFQLQSLKEKVRPAETSLRQWQQYLSGLRRRSLDYGQQALSEFGRALSLRPLEISSIRQVCEIYRRFERLPEARACFAWLAQRQPDRWIHAYRLGTVLIRLGEYTAAERSLKRALALAPSQGDIYFALGLSYVRAGRLAEATSVFKQGTIFEPFNPALYTNLGATYASRGEHALARKALRRALQLSTFPLPRLHLTYTNLALVHWQEGRDEEAVKALENALYVFPDDAYARRLLALVTSGRARGGLAGRRRADYVFNDLLELFGEVTTVAFDNE